MCLAPSPPFPYPLSREHAYITLKSSGVAALLDISTTGVRSLSCPVGMAVAA